MTDFRKLEELALLTTLIAGEAESEPVLGKIAVGCVVIGGIVTMAKAWIAVNTRQKEHAKLIEDLIKRIEQMQIACRATHKEVDTDRIRLLCY
jgi:hypothetical protein